MMKVPKRSFVVVVLGEVPRDVFERALELIDAVTNPLELGTAHPHLVAPRSPRQLAASEL